MANSVSVSVTSFPPLLTLRPARSTSSPSSVQRGGGLAAVLLVAAQQGGDLRQKFPLGEGLGQKIVAPAAVGGEAVGLGGFGGQKQDRHVGERADAVAGLKAVHAGHHHVQHDEIGLRVRLDPAHGGLTVGGLGHRVVVAQKHIQNLADIGIVVHNEYQGTFFHVITSRTFYHVRRKLTIRS